MDAPESLSLADFDAIGFDMDHTLARYRMKDFLELVFNSLRRLLVEEQNFPKELLTYPFDVDFVFKCIVLDLTTGDFLKLSENGHVLRASHGTKPLSSEQILLRYNNAPWWGFEDVKAHRKSDRYFYFLTYFDMPASYLCALLVDLYDRRGLYDGKLYDFLGPLFAAFRSCYSPRNFRNRSGYFFQAIEDHPERYLYEDKVVRAWLVRLRKAGKKVFFMSNSDFDFVDFVMSYIYGEDWTELFHICIAKACKPSFFTQPEPFRQVDWTGESEGEAVTDIRLKEPTAEVKPGTVPSKAARLMYSKGNHKQLGELLGERVLYFGDHLVGDVATVSRSGWHAAAVVEEMVHVTYLTGQDRPVEHVTGSHARESKFFGKFFSKALPEAASDGAITRDELVLSKPILMEIAEGKQSELANETPRTLAERELITHALVSVCSIESLIPLDLDDPLFVPCSNSTTMLFRQSSTPLIH
mmetsp:Transcript_13566/g.38559  ORF Transcript_13566/g.38559 Transcript_13566/m.38559 type:complete len:470 (+) Transcript_13566:187-1596(+)|eukprot:CAMPEP_0119153180 /NCGR_PEP_ID=MMETSP1310-20130426/48828_1 /TAXON_ID=464262 /ORGANISM="Genus nov. species nov., Strain RCC2339" /LENGTH=469 /DNA_ID=CAMNT_0007145607 /DNA_START=180 /DNA_END=1589 /DNA_ORIENTATION=-